MMVSFFEWLNSLSCILRQDSNRPTSGESFKNCEVFLEGQQERPAGHRRYSDVTATTNGRTLTLPITKSRRLISVSGNGFFQVHL